MRDLESTNVDAAAYLAQGADPLPLGRPLTPSEVCEGAGHEWTDAGGGLLICACCQAERWSDSP